MSKGTLAVVIAASVVGGVAFAQDRAPLGSVEARLDRIEQAIVRLEQKVSSRGGGGMMEGCRDMMGGGMMGGGMMGRGGMMGGGQPNEHWRLPDSKR